MDDQRKPSPRLAPLPPDPALNEQFEVSRKTLGFIPNSMLIMQRNPKMLRAWMQLTSAIWDPQSQVDRGLKRLVAHVSSRAAGCNYCMAHTAGGAAHLGVEDEKILKVWEYQTSDLYSDAERAALDLAVAAGSVPNAANDEHFARLRLYWSEDQIVEIVGVIATFGFLNRWNDTLGTPLEEEPLAAGAKFLAHKGWTPGKHRG